MAIQALIFDVFGTLLDWHGGVAREAVRLLAPFRPDLDGAAFARAWRDRYQPGMEPIRQGARSYADLDTLHAESLDGVLAGLHLAETVPPEVHHELVLAWHRLDAWPEVPDALARLRERYLLAPCSNAHVRLAIAQARRNRLPWDAVLGAEFAQDYKPKPAVYLRAVEALRLQPGEVMMVGPTPRISRRRRPAALPPPMSHGPTRAAQHRRGGAPGAGGCCGIGFGGSGEAARLLRTGHANRHPTHSPQDEVESGVKSVNRRHGSCA